jgi:hypothetical protein
VRVDLVGQFCKNYTHGWNYEPASSRLGPRSSSSRPVYRIPNWYLAGHRHIQKHTPHPMEEVQL